MSGSQRIAKFIAHAGVCSRREAEKLILKGDVTVDGQIIDSPALNVNTDNEICVNGQKIHQRKETLLWLFHKPRGVITSNNDPQGRSLIFDILPKNLPRVVTVGRLDYNTEGLILLTNNGEFAGKLEHPSANLKRTYRVRVIGNVNPQKLLELKDGITIQDEQTGQNIRYRGVEAQIDKTSGNKNTWLLMSIWEGKNREIRKICQHLGLNVNRLIRVKYGEFALGSLAAGDIIEVPQATIRKII